MFKLDLEPYNTNRIDCYWNNVIAILMTRDSAFESLVPLITSQYEIEIPRREVITDVVYKYKQENGILLPYVTRNLSNALLDEYIQQVDLPLYRDTDAVELVKGYLNEGTYCILRLNRFHFPFCPECRKAELIHPVLVYGYSDELSTFYMVEDCVPPGKIVKHELSYQDFRLSYDSIPTDQLFGLGLRIIKEQLDTQSPYRIIQSNIGKQLYGESVASEETTTMRGLGVLEYFRDHFSEITLSANDLHSNMSHRLSYSLFYQKRNLMLVDYLQNQGVFGRNDYEELQKGFTDLYDNWALIRSKVIQYYIKPDRPDAQAYALTMRPYLDACLKESELLMQLLDCLNRAVGETS
ncbi:hypothetical protein [Paenibacillus sp. FSL H8-0537]|uniref:hypothetical protein n=1 Tax=Paenibacillus sp. FSL H8-0537 TaxID=2921399 RepID=UPI003100F465